MTRNVSALPLTRTAQLWDHEYSIGAAFGSRDVDTWMPSLEIPYQPRPHVNHVNRRFDRVVVLVHSPVQS